MGNLTHNSILIGTGAMITKAVIEDKRYANWLKTCRLAILDAPDDEFYRAQINATLHTIRPWVGAVHLRGTGTVDKLKLSMKRKSINRIFLNINRPIIVTLPKLGNRADLSVNVEAFLWCASRCHPGLDIVNLFRVKITHNSIKIGDEKYVHIP